MDAIAFRKTGGRLGGSIFLNSTTATSRSMARVAGEGTLPCSVTSFVSSKAVLIQPGALLMLHYLL
jgi:hypothetical protein